MQSEILSKVKGNSLEFEAFAPEAMFLVVCLNRWVFLKENERMETDYYRRVSPEMAYLHGNAEFYNISGKGGMTHGSLVAIGIKEDGASFGEALDNKTDSGDYAEEMPPSLERRLGELYHKVTRKIHTCMDLTTTNDNSRETAVIPYGCIP